MATILIRLEPRTPAPSYTPNEMFIYNNAVQMIKSWATLTEPLYNTALGINFMACLTPRSPRTSSAPPRMASNL